MAQRAVITGLGIIAPNGIGKERYWDAIVSGRSGIRKISRFDTSAYPVKTGGEVLDFSPADYMDRKKERMLSRFAQFALAASRMALEDAALVIEQENPYRVGVAVGTALGGKEVDEEQQRAFYEKGCGTMNPISMPMAGNNFALGAIAMEYGIHGPNATFSTGCTSGINAIAYAADMVSTQRADVMIAGGSEAPILPAVFESLCMAGVLSRCGEPETACRPFDKNRDGYVIAEGCGIIIIESAEHARRRNARIYAEIAGCGVTNDAFSLIRMEPTGKEVARAIEIALRSAGVTAGDVDYINAHGSSSLVTDKRETNAIKSVFGDHSYKLSVSSIKSMIGQPFAAAGSLQVISTALSIQDGTIPPTINYEEKDPDCDLDYTPNYPRRRDIDCALVNAFGMGGNNVSLLLRKYTNAKEVAACALH
jgi:3-oxoacyl-[acyl-carrier-protein] synthase II